MQNMDKEQNYFIKRNTTETNGENKPENNNLEKMSIILYQDGNFILED